MFIGNNNLATITYGDNFIRKVDSDISSMFSGCPANKPDHSSWNGAFQKYNQVLFFKIFCKKK